MTDKVMSIQSNIYLSIDGLAIRYDQIFPAPITNSSLIQTQISSLITYKIPFLKFFTLHYSNLH